MKLSIFVSLTAAGLLAGCGHDSSSQNAGTNAAADYAGTLGKAKTTADKTIDTAALNQAVQLFNVQEGRYPKTLQELVPKYAGKIPDAPVGFKLDYDAATGEVKVGPQ